MFSLKIRKDLVFRSQLNFFNLKNQFIVLKTSKKAEFSQYFSTFKKNYKIMKLLEKLKTGLMVMLFFVLTIGLTACNEGESNEEDTKTEAHGEDHHDLDDEHHDHDHDAEHPADGEEHPADGEEHPADEGSEEHPA